MRASARITRCGHLRRLTALVAAVIAIDARAELVEIAWDLSRTVAAVQRHFAHHRRSAFADHCTAVRATVQDHLSEDHHTPSGAVKQFVYCHCVMH